MHVAERLRRLDDRVLGPPKPVTLHTHRNGVLVGLAGTVAALAFASYNDSTSVAVASSGFFGGMLGSGWRWLCTLRREERLRARQVAASLLVVATLLGWFTVLLLHDEDVPRYTRETCELARNGFPGGDRVSSLDDILRACVEDGQ